MKSPKLRLTELISRMDYNEAVVARRVYADYKAVIETIPGSSTKHQVWEGGYLSHIEEAMNIALLLHESLSSCRSIDATLSDALFCTFLHDFDKVQRYRFKDGQNSAIAKYSADMVDKTIALLQDNYGYTLSANQINALKYAHGEGLDYHPSDRVMLPLATIVHCADVISARVWFDKGRLHDSWEK